MMLDDKELGLRLRACWQRSSETVMELREAVLKAGNHPAKRLGRIIFSATPA